MARGEHKYQTTVEWTGNHGTGTSGYRAYGREHVIWSGNKPEIPGSSDPAFLGDPSRWNPEELLLASVSACHKLWYLHLCADAGIAVLAYVDQAEGTMTDRTTSPIPSIFRSCANPSSFRADSRRRAARRGLL